MLQKIMDILLAIRPEQDLSIIREELIKGQGYLLQYETRHADADWSTWIGFARFADNAGGIVLEWEHQIIRGTRLPGMSVAVSKKK